MHPRHERKCGRTLLESVIQGRKSRPCGARRLLDFLRGLLHPPDYRFVTTENYTGEGLGASPGADKDVEKKIWSQILVLVYTGGWYD